jgi:hypothetical protein
MQLVSLRKRPKELVICSHCARLYQEGTIYGSERGPLPDTESVGPLILGCPVSKTMRKKVSVVYKPLHLQHFIIASGPT